MFIRLISPEVKLTVSSGLMFCTGMGYAAGPSAGTKVLSENQATNILLKPKTTIFGVRKILKGWGKNSRTMAGIAMYKST